MDVNERELAAVSITRARAEKYIHDSETAANFADARDFWDCVPLDDRRKIRADLEVGAKRVGVSVLDFSERVAQIATQNVVACGSLADVLTGIASFMAGLDIAREIVARTSTPAEVATDGR